MWKLRYLPLDSADLKSLKISKGTALYRYTNPETYVTIKDFES